MELMKQTAHEPSAYTGGVRPARPHTELTADGRRRREVLSYSRRGSRMGPRMTQAWERHRDRWWIPDGAVDEPGFDLRAWFGREAPMIVEVGCGVGEATAALAAARPSYDVLGLEVWLPGVADTFHRLEQAGVDNVRMMSLDAAWVVEHLLSENSVSELWTFFPDPWPKKRHHRRRLVGPDFAAAAAGRLAPGGLWRLATDWPDYAERMLEVLEAEPLLENVYDGSAPRWDDRPVTRFERRGLDAGRTVTDLTFRRR
jgi:tRNA (guanine-N7-)-methyltransferase